MKIVGIILSAIICGAMADAAAQSGGRNPLVLDSYAADPSAHVFHDTLWVYPSHDRSDAVRFDMEDYHVYSTTDMEHWRDHGVIFNPLRQTSWAKSCAWAPDCVERDGKFYLYFPTDKRHIGVAVADRPDGPFRDALGHPLISIDSPGVVCDRDFIDPCVFIDRDGRAYLYVGQNTPLCVPLAADMVSLADSVHVLDGVPDFFEAAWMHRVGDTYYFSYSDGPFNHHQPRIAYCTATNPLGPFTYRGIILDPVNSGTNHHSIVQFRGQWWLFYHTADLSLYNEPFSHPGVRRSIAADRLHYATDGSIRRVMPTHSWSRVMANAAAPRNGNVHLLSDRIRVSGSGLLYYDVTANAIGQNDDDERETVILLHGHSLDRRMWDEQLGVLAEKYRVVRIDLRGYGLSSDQVEGERFTHADDVVAVMDSLDIDRAHVVGLSMGSFIAGDLVAMYPERLLSCTMASGGIRNSPSVNEPMDSAEWARKSADIESVRAKGIGQYKKEWLEILLQSGGSQRERMRKPLARMVDEWTAWQALNHESHCYYGREAMDSLRARRPSVPCLFVRGANDWREGSRIGMMDYLPNSRLVVLPDCGHVMNMDRPEEFNRVLMEFLEGARE